MQINRLSNSITVLFIVDFLIFLLGFLIVLIILKFNINIKYLTLGILSSFCWSFVLFLKGFYQIRKYKFSGKDSYHIFEAVLLGSFFQIVLFSFFHNFLIKHVLITSSLIIPMLLAWRIVFNYYVKNLKSSKNVLIIGSGNSAGIIIKEIQKQKKLKYNIVGLIDDDPDKLDKEFFGIKILGNSSNIKNIVKELNIKIIVIAYNMP